MVGYNQRKYLKRMMQLQFDMKEGTDMHSNILFRRSLLLLVGSAARKIVLGGQQEVPGSQEKGNNISKISGY